MLHRMLFVPVMLAASFLCLTAQGQPGKDKEEKPDPAAESVELVTSGAALVEYGRKTKSPEALITAAGMLKRVPPSTLLKAEPEKGDIVPEGSGKLPSLREEADELLAEAKKMSKDDPVVVAMADAVANRKVSRGASGGPRLVQNALLPKSSYTMKVPVAGGAPMTFGVTGTGNVQIKVVARFHAKGHNILIVESAGIMGSRTFLPPVNGSLHITVSNPNTVGTFYRVATN